MFHHFHDNVIHKKGQGSIDKDDFYKMINFIGRNNILDAEYSETNLVPMPGFNSLIGIKYSIN